MGRAAHASALTTAVKGSAPASRPGERAVLPLRRRRVLAFFLALVVALVAFAVPLFGPPPDEPERLCGRFQPLISDHGYYENCDSIVFVELAQDPTQLFDEMQDRQSRPVFVLMGAVGGIAAVPVGELLGLSEDGSYRVGYRLLNLLLLSAAILIAWALLTRAAVDVVLRACVVAILVVNGVTKAFVWTAHTNMFNILVPLLLVVLAFSVLRRARWRLRTVFGVGLVSGFAFLAYGSLVLVVPVFVIARCVALHRARAFRVWPMVREAAVLAGSFVLPSVMWIGTVRAMTGSYYSAETSRYRQFVWIVDALRAGGGRFLDELGRNTLSFLDTIVSPDVLPIVIIATLVLAIPARRSEVQVCATDSVRQIRLQLMLAATIVVIVEAVFQWSMGFYESRLTFSLVPPLLVMIVLRAPRLANALWTRVGALTFTGAWVVMQVLREGPFN